LRRVTLVALAILLVSQSSSADEPEVARERVTLTYRVAPGCPDEKAFVAVVTERTQRGTFVADEPTPRRFLVEIRRRGSGYDGHLVIEGPSANGPANGRAVRALTSPRCADLVRAFALFTALAIEPESDGVPSVAPPSPEAEPERPPVSSLPVSDRERSDAPTEPRAVRSPAATRQEHEHAVPRVWQAGVGSGALAAGGVAQSIMLSAHPVIEVASSGPLLSPSARLGLVWANSDAERAGTAGLTYGLRAAVVSGCPFRLPVGDVLGARLCVAFEAGRLEVRAFGVELPRRFAKPWFAAEPLLRLDVPILRSRLSFEAEAGVAFPFDRLRSYVNPGPVVADVGAAGLRLGAVVLLQAF
jgi:hypothetical protein